MSGSQVCWGASASCHREIKTNVLISYFIFVDLHVITVTVRQPTQQCQLQLPRHPRSGPSTSAADQLGRRVSLGSGWPSDLLPYLSLLCWPSYARSVPLLCLCCATWRTPWPPICALVSPWMAGVISRWYSATLIASQLGNDSLRHHIQLKFESLCVGFDCN